LNLVDLLIIVVVALAAVHGVTQGAAMQVLSFGGFWIGLIVGAALAPFISHIVGQSTFAKAFVSLVVFFGFALAGGAIGRYFGTHAWGALRRLKLGGADSAFGAVVAILAALAAVWLIALLLTAGPTPSVARAVNDSAIIRALTNRLPPAPSVFTRLQAFINTTPFPRVFEGLEPIPAGPVNMPSDPAIAAAVRAAGASTVRIEGFGCGGIQTGSGFVVAPDLVVTNAHVVAGIPSLEISDRRGRHRATAILFDPTLDLAVLRTGRLSDPPLTILRSDVHRGTGGAVLGYPGGEPRLSAGPGAVLREFAALGRDIYGRSPSRRNVYQLQATIRQGNSGGPFVRSDGVVLGVVFAASTSDPNVGYALTSAEVASRVDQARGRTSGVGTGPCAA
jgi:S1-C subfamily serine protease